MLTRSPASSRSASAASSPATPPPAITTLNGSLVVIHRGCRIPVRPPSEEIRRDPRRTTESEQPGENLEEARVLRRRAIADAQGPRLAERPPGADEHALLRQPADDRRLVPALAEIEPAEVGLRLGGVEAQAGQLLG